MLGVLPGQFAKPRSKDYEEINGVKMLNYRGDLINSYEPNAEARKPDPARMIEAYNKSGLTLELSPRPNR